VPWAKAHGKVEVCRVLLEIAHGKDHMVFLFYFILLIPYSK
jgi:hypothetical protein